MKSFLLLSILFTVFKISAQNSSHFQYHGGNVVFEASAQGYFGYSLNKGYSFSLIPNKVPNDEDLMAAKTSDTNNFLDADRKQQTWTQKVTFSKPRNRCLKF